MANKAKNGLKETSEVVVEKTPVVKEVTVEVVSEEEVKSPGHTTRAFR